MTTPQLIIMNVNLHQFSQDQRKRNKFAFSCPKFDNPENNK